MIVNQPTEGCAFMTGHSRKTVAAICTLAICWSLLASVSTSTAATIIGPAVQLSTLIPPGGGTVVAGDKTFSNFSYLATGDMPAAVNVNVVPIIDDLGNYGVRFQGAFIDTTGVAGGSDALITYTVTAASGMLISGARMEGNPARLGPFGSISAVDTFLPLTQIPPYRLRIFDDQNLGIQMVDTTAFTPTQSLNVQKDILGLAKMNPSDPNQPSTVTMSFVDQTYIQIPEPAACLLLATAGIGLAFFRRQRSVG
jgi:hypothetical protein